jgi:hypothetical protein
MELPHPAQKPDLPLCSFNLLLLGMDQLKGCSRCSEDCVADGFQKCWQKYVAATEQYEVSSKSTETESVNTRILYLKG